MVPAIITMKRGTVIHADHARFVTYPSGVKMLVAGIKPALVESVTTNSDGGANTPLVRRLRDFYTPQRYEYASWQDETGWDVPDEDGWYSAHRDCIYGKKFKKVLTIREHNIESIEWV